jgi:ElaB/YqjD/DUF883 family membrane-anchored ribosome-binding protein
MTTNDAAEQLDETVQDLKKGQTGAYLREGDRLVRERPWVAVGLAAGIGFLVGTLIAVNVFNGDSDD